MSFGKSQGLLDEVIRYLQYLIAVRQVMSRLIVLQDFLSGLQYLCVCVCVYLIATKGQANSDWQTSCISVKQTKCPKLEADFQQSLILHQIRPQTVRTLA